MRRTRTDKMKILASTTIALLACLALWAGTAAAVPGTGTELEFAGDTAELAAGQIAVPVECVGESTTFCSGTLTLSWHGKRSVSAFSVEGGHDETVIVPLPNKGVDRRARVAAVATTSQPLGSAVTHKAVLHLG
jgi:hypothetical protein